MIHNLISLERITSDPDIYRASLIADLAGTGLFSPVHEAPGIIPYSKLPKWAKDSIALLDLAGLHEGIEGVGTKVYVGGYYLVNKAKRKRDSIFSRCIIREYPNGYNTGATG